MAKLLPPTDLNSFLAGIGHICLQWALLEQTVLFVIASAETLPIDKVYPRYCGLDMLPRLNMAIGLTREAKWPVRLTRPLVEIRTALQRGGGGIADRRNLFVHGVHKLTDVPGEYELTMARWGPDKRDQTVTVVDAAELANRIAQLVQKAEGVFRDYGIWKFGSEHQADRGEPIAHRVATARIIRAHNIKRALKLLFTNLKPW